MGKVVADITMSLDGFITGPGDVPGRGLGEGGECLHNWVMGRPWRYDDEGRRFDPLDVDREVLFEAMGSTGAGIIGKRMFDITGGWGGNPPGGPNARYFVLTHSVPAEWVSTESPFTFVTDGIESAGAGQVRRRGPGRRYRRGCQRDPAVPGRPARRRAPAAPGAGTARRG
jgi:dihydrofolate reductase